MAPQCWRLTVIVLVASTYATPILRRFRCQTAIAMQTLLNHSLPHSSQLSPVDDLDENTVPVNQSQCYVTPDMFPSYSLQDESSLSYFEDIFAGYIDSSAPVDATPPNGSPGKCHSASLKDLSN